MNSRKIIVKYFIVIILALIVFITNASEHVNSQTNIAFIVVFVIIKAVVFMFESLQKVIEVSKNDTPYYQFLLFLGLNIALIILSFSIDYYCLYKASPLSFSGVQRHESALFIFIDFIYLSIMAFTNFGYGNILAMSMVAKFILTIELIISYAFIIFILSDFISLKESIANKISRK